MAITELFVLAVGLSMDAFAVAICKGLAMGKASLKASVVVGIWFGAFQALMPTIGYFLGLQLQSLIQSFDHWVAFLLLLAIGISMIVESRKSDDEEVSPSIGVKAMLPLAVATSIDALASGIALAAIDGSIAWAAAFIGCITFTLSAIGVYIGTKAGSKYKGASELIGGIILVAIGAKILIEHLMEGI